MEETLARANEILGTNHYDWLSVSAHKFLTEDFIREFADKVDWINISRYQQLSEDFIREFSSRVDWDYISTHQRLSENFIREFADKVDWINTSLFHQLSEGFIREFADKVDWINISIHQQLSEEFIREFKDDVNWDWISMNQHLSEDFIREFTDRVNWYCISMYQHLSDKFIGEFKGMLDMEFIADSWHYKSTEEKKKAVERTGLYECHEDYFVAYKGMRSDRYSKFNFHYQYLKGHTYETWCDCSMMENGYGFSAWTEKGAWAYCNELVVRVKVRYEDVGRVVHKGGKIRCVKLQVLD